jgi:multidrug resistance efflux pump
VQGFVKEYKHTKTAAGEQILDAALRFQQGEVIPPCSGRIGKRETEKGSAK